MAMKDVLLPSILFALALVGCDIVDNPIPPGGSNQVEFTCTDTLPLNTTRRVLLEDFNGFRCTNCPTATDIALGLGALHGEELVLVGIHVLQSFAGTVPPDFTTEFRTDAGNIYAQDFGISFLPVGPVSRKPYNSFLLLDATDWAGAVDAIIGEPADMDVQLACFNFDENTNEVSVTARVIALNDVTGDHNLVIYLTEDHVIDWQLDVRVTDPPSGAVSDYDHRHVLRGNLNGAYGDPAVTGTLAAGDTVSRSFSYTLPSNVIEPNNCALVAYVARTDTKEIMQVVERKFVP